MLYPYIQNYIPDFIKEPHFGGGRQSFSVKSLLSWNLFCRPGLCLSAGIKGVCRHGVICDVKILKLVKGHEC